MWSASEYTGLIIAILLTVATIGLLYVILASVVGAMVGH
jgi:hypothetical protein